MEGSDAVEYMVKLNGAEIKRIIHMLLRDAHYLDDMREVTQQPTVEESACDHLVRKLTKQTGINVVYTPMGYDDDESEVKNKD